MQPERERSIVYPGLTDPRWLQLAFLFAFVIYAETSPRFSRNWKQWLAGVCTSVVLDFVLSRALRGVLVLPISGLISGMGLLLLCDSPNVWPYALCAALAIASKYAIRVNGKHVFNPANFAVVVGLLLLSHHMTIVAGRWGGGLGGVALVAALGVVVVFRANRLDLSMSWVAGFLAGACVNSMLSGLAFRIVATPITGAAFQLFTFFMISDPMTTPETRFGRITFGLLLGVLDAVLRRMHVTHSVFYALIILSSFLPLFRLVFAPVTPEQVWRPMTWRLGRRATPLAAPRS